MGRQFRFALRLALFGVIGAVGVAGAAGVQAQEDAFFPNTEALGRAAVEYRDDEIHVVAAYYHSQRNHDSRWLLIQAGLSTTRNLTIDRENIALITPDGRRLQLPLQARVAQEVQNIRPVVQSAVVNRHNVLSYFRLQSWAEPMRLFSLSSGAVLTNFVTDTHRVAYGDLLFENPRGLWERGTYSLVIERDGVRAVLPVELE
jgi:hypothetical protein